MFIMGQRIEESKRFLAEFKVPTACVSKDSALLNQNLYYDKTSKYVVKAIILR